MALDEAKALGRTVRRNGRAALAIGVPPTGENQPWAYDPTSARLDRLGNAAAPGALPSAVAIAPDAIHTAAILHADGLDGAAADQLTIDGPDGPRQPVSSDAVGERLLDVSWSPTVSGVLVLSQRQVTRGKHSLVRWVEIDGIIRDLADLPGEPLAGSWAWASDGHAVAFLVHATTTALVALDIERGELRFLDDLRADGLPSSGAVAPATWVPSGALLYAAPTLGTGFPGTSGTSAPVLFEVAPGRIDSHPPDERLTTGAWLDKWFETLHVPEIKPSTRRYQRSILHRHLLPSLGHIPLIRLRAVDVIHYLETKRKEGLTAGVVGSQRGGGRNLNAVPSMS